MNAYEIINYNPSSNKMPNKKILLDETENDFTHNFMYECMRAVN